MAAMNSSKSLSIEAHRLSTILYVAVARVTKVAVLLTISVMVESARGILAFYEFHQERANPAEPMNGAVHVRNDTLRALQAEGAFNLNLH
jgi:hypothetical protein